MAGSVWLTCQLNSTSNDWLQLRKLTVYYQCVCYTKPYIAAAAPAAPAAATTTTTTTILRPPGQCPGLSG